MPSAGTPDDMDKVYDVQGTLEVWVSRSMARAFALPRTQPGTHTHTHTALTFDSRARVRSLRHSRGGGPPFEHWIEQCCDPLDGRKLG